MSNLNKIQRKLQKKTPSYLVARSFSTGLHRITQILEFAMKPDEMHTTYAPGSPYVTTPLGQRLKAATTKGKPRRLYSRGYQTRYEKVPTEHGYVYNVLGKEGKPKGEPVLRDIVRHPTKKVQHDWTIGSFEGRPLEKIDPGYLGKLGEKVKVGGVKAEVVGKYPAYSTERYRPHAYLKAKMGIESEKVRDELMAKAVPEKEVKGAQKAARKNILKAYVAKAQEDALATGRTARLSPKEIRTRVRENINREIKAHRDYRAGELRESRAIIHARGVPLRTARMENERLSKYVARLGEMAEARKTGVEAIRTRAMGRLQKIAERGVSQIDPQITPSVLPEEISRRAGQLVGGLKQKAEYGPMSEMQKSELGRTLKAGISKPRTTFPSVPWQGGKLSEQSMTERVGKLHERMEKLRDLAITPGGEAEIREKLVRSKRLFKGLPKVAKVETGYPFLRRAGLGLGAAGAVAGGAYLAKRLLYPKRREHQFASLPPDQIAQLDKLALKMKKILPFAKPRLSELPKKQRRRLVLNRYKEAVVRKVQRAYGIPTDIPVASEQFGLDPATTLKKTYGSSSTKPINPIERMTKAYEDTMNKNVILSKQIRQVQGEAERTIKAEQAARVPLIEAHGLKQHQIGYKRGQAYEAERGKAYRQEQIAKAKETLGAKHASQVSKLKWAGAGLIGGAGAGGYIVGRGKRQRDHEFSAWSNLRDKISGHSEEEGPSPYHDIAVGALEGGAAFPVSDYLIRRFAGKGSGWGRKIAVGAGVGGAATGLIGIGVSNILRGRKKIQTKKEQEQRRWFNSRFKEIRFQYPQRKPNQRMLVARDRYIKQIKERDIDVANQHYIHSALLGAGLGAVLRKPGNLSKAVLGGAAAGIGVQKATRIYGAHTRDPFGERTITAKRVERAPTYAGLGALAYLGLRKARKLKLSAKGRVIYFQDEYDPNDPLTKWSKKWLYKKDYSTAAHAQKIRKWGGRTTRTFRDIKESREGTIPKDARGRPRKREWQKPWVAAALTVGALRGGLWGVQKARGVIRAAPVTSKLGQLREGFLTGEYRKKVPGLQKVGAFYQGVKEDLKRVVYAPAEKVKYDIAKVDPKTGKMKSPKRLATEMATGKQKKLFADIGEEKKTKEAFKPPPKTKKEETEWSARGPVIQFKEKWVDNPLYPKGEKRSIQEIPIKKIVSHQDALKSHVVKKYKEKPGRGLPTLHKVGGKYYVEDGNHRIVSKMEKGETHVRASVRELRARLREIRFAETLPYWDIRDERGRSARVYAPGAQRRYREPMPEWKKKAHQRHIWEGISGGIAAAGGLAAIAAGKRGFKTGFEHGRARVIGSTGHPVAYHHGAYLEPTYHPDDPSGIFSWVRMPKPKSQPPVNFAVQESQPQKRKHNVAAGLAVAAAGLPLYKGAGKFARIGLRSSIDKLAGRRMSHGKQVADYIEATQHVLNRGVTGKLAGVVLRNPKHPLVKKLLPGARSGIKKLDLEHYSAFRSSPTEALDAWAGELAASRPKGPKRDAIQAHYEHLTGHLQKLWTKGYNEQEALRHVSTDPQHENFFRLLAAHKAAPTKYYQKITAGLAAVPATAATAVAATTRKNDRRGVTQ